MTVEGWLLHVCTGMRYDAHTLEQTRRMHMYLQLCRTWWQRYGHVLQYAIQTEQRPPLWIARKT